jgi:hypothetical protein
VNTEFETFQYTKDDWATDTYWNDHYAMINQANQELYIADSLKVTDEASLRNIGEALFFRAFSYFELVKAYGEVPLLNFYSTDAKANVKPKSPVALIYQQIDSDLNVAATYLPVNWVDINNNNKYPGRLTKGAALSLHAQTYLFRSDWGNVSSLCSQVIALSEYELMPKFVDIWEDGLDGAGKNNKESIFRNAVLGRPKWNILLWRSVGHLSKCETGRSKPGLESGLGLEYTYPGFANRLGFHGST